MKFYHTTKNEESARNIVANGVDSKKAHNNKKVVSFYGPIYKEH